MFRTREYVWIFFNRPIKQYECRILVQKKVRLSLLWTLQTCGSDNFLQYKQLYEYNRNNIVYK